MATLPECEHRARVGSRLTLCCCLRCTVQRHIAVTTTRSQHAEHLGAVLTRAVAENA